MNRKIRAAYDPHERVQFATVGESRTHISMAPECDINRIMLKWQKTGIIEHRNTFEGQYGDFTNLPQDYHESMNTVIDAQEMFMTLPATVRRRFLNDPGHFLDFVTNPENMEELVKLGLATKVAKGDEAELVTPPEPPPSPKKANPAPPPKPSDSQQ